MYGERPDDHFAVSYDPDIARTARENRQERLRRADVAIEEVLASLKRASDPAVRQRGRKLTPEGAQLSIHDYLRDHEAGRFYQVHLHAEVPLGLRVAPDEEARAFEGKIDGILIVEGSRRDFTPEEMIEKYRSLAEIERSWRTLKSTLRLRPILHWTEDRIRSHVFLCVLALAVEGS